MAPTDQCAALNVRDDDLSGLDLGNQGTGTRSLSSSNQFRTMLIRSGSASLAVIAASRASRIVRRSLSHRGGHPTPSDRAFG